MNLSVAWAQKKDSSDLILELKTTDDHKKLKVLEKIYSEIYGLNSVLGHSYAFQAVDLGKKLNDKATVAGAYYYLSYYYLWKGMMDSSLYYCQAGLDLSRRINSKSLIARGYGRLGDYYHTNGDKPKAVEFLKKAIELDSTDYPLVANCSITLGILYKDAGSLKESAYYYLKALKIREERKEFTEAGFVCTNLSGLYFMFSYKNQGFAYAMTALDYFRKVKVQGGESYVYNLLGEEYFKLKEYPAALTFFRKALAINGEDTTIIRSGRTFNMINIGDTWLKLKRYDSAQFYYSRVLRYITRIHDYLALACTYLSMGDMNAQLKNYTIAIRFLNDGLYYSQLVNYRVQWEQAYELLAKCYEASGQRDKALFCLKKHNELQDSIFTEKAHQDVANMMIKYETRKKDQQISILNVDSREKQAKIRMAVLTILIIISLAGLLGYLAWSYYRKKLRPKVRSLNFIQEKIKIEKEGDNRKLRALDKLLPPELKPFTNSRLPEVEINKDLIVRLETLLIKDKIYLNMNLTLAETAHMLDTNTSYLSRLINDHYQVNFSAFLGRYRIEEAKKMILDDHFNNISIEGIANNSGFRSKSTFNQVFKVSTGLTPTEFALKNGKIRT